MAILLSLGVVALTLSPASGDEEEGAQGQLFFSPEVSKRDNANILCGEQTTYTLTSTVPPAVEAYLGRSVLEAHSCETNWDFIALFNFTVAGDVTVSFPLGCEMIGVIQNVQSLGLESVTVTVLKNGAALVSGERFVNNIICPAAQPYPVNMVLAGLGETGSAFAPGDKLTVRLNLRAVNTESAILRYWFLFTGGANVTAEGLNIPPPPPTASPSPTPPPSTTTATPPPTTTPSPATSPPPTSPAPGGPSCSRDQPPEGEIERPPQEDFDLSALCADPDDDLDRGEWRVDGVLVETDSLGASPATAKATFNLEEEGPHTIECIPFDQEENEGEPASWTVTVTRAGPAPTTPIPFFPSSAALALGLLGALGGTVLVWRRP